MIEDILIVGLFTFGSVTFFRLMLIDVQWLTRSIGKIFLVGVVATVGTFLVVDQPVASRDIMVTTWAGAGAAMLFHRLHRLLGAIGDQARLNVLQGDVRRNRGY